MKKPIHYGEAKLKVRYAETDQMGVVYHANYIVWLELGRESFLEQILKKDYIELEKKGIVAPITEVNVKYIKSAKYGDEITIHTWAAKATPLRVTYHYELYNQNGELLARAETQGVCVEKDQFKLVNMKKEAADWYEAYQQFILTYMETI